MISINFLFFTGSPYTLCQAQEHLTNPPLGVQIAFGKSSVEIRYCSVSTLYMVLYLTSLYFVRIHCFSEIQVCYRTKGETADSRILESLGVPRSPLESLGVPRSPLESLGLPWSPFGVP
jgi:hypothetical protein